jgi:hypothetical protein
VSRQSRHSKAFIIAPSYIGDRDSDEVSQNESIVNHVHDIKHADEKEEFTLETEIPSPYFELPRSPKNVHSRLSTAKAIEVKFPTPELNSIELAEPGSPNPASSYAPPEYIKQPNL